MNHSISEDEFVKLANGKFGYGLDGSAAKAIISNGLGDFFEETLLRLIFRSKNADYA